MAFSRAAKQTLNSIFGARPGPFQKGGKSGANHISHTDHKTPRARGAHDLGLDPCAPAGAPHFLPPPAEFPQKLPERRCFSAWCGSRQINPRLFHERSLSVIKTGSGKRGYDVTAIPQSWTDTFLIVLTKMYSCDHDRESGCTVYNVHMTSASLLTRIPAKRIMGPPSDSFESIWRITMVMTGLPGAARGKLTHSGNVWMEYMWDQKASAQTSTLADINTYEIRCEDGCP